MHACAVICVQVCAQNPLPHTQLGARAGAERVDISAPTKAAGACRGAGTGTGTGTGQPACPSPDEPSPMPQAR